MKTYYSIVSIATKPQFDEKFGVGLLCVSPEEIYFHFSQRKFNIVSKLLPKGAASLALSSLKSIDRGVRDSSETSELLFKGGDRSGMVSEGYLNYLNRYNNNLVQFSVPVSLDIEMDQSTFEAIFRKFIYADEVFQQTMMLVDMPNKPSFNTYKKSIQKKAEVYVNTNYPVSKERISGLVFPITVDMFGKNGAYVTAQTIDFSKGNTALHNAINEYMYLALSTEMNDDNAKCFILGDEPDKSLEANHKIWTNTRENSKVEYVPFDESDRVIEFFKEKGVEPVE